MNTDFGAAESAGETKPPRKGWPLSRWLLLIVLVLAAHVALIFMFGTREPIKPRSVTNAPQLQLAGGADEWLLLNDPTLFALPSREGFAGPAWLEPPPLRVHMVDWTEKPRWLVLTDALPFGKLGAVFNEFMQTNRFATFQFELGPPAEFTTPMVPLQPAIPENSTLHVEGKLAKRSLLTPIQLPSWPNDDVIAPSRIQVLVDAAGYVVSAVLLPPRYPGEVHGTEADQRALDLARDARFAPASGLTVGRLIFDWRTVPSNGTNAPLPVL